jgi:hypothetical protein
VQNIDAAELRHCGFHNGPCDILVREIVPVRDCPRAGFANLVSDFDGLSQVDIDDRYRGTFAGQFACRRRTNSSRATRNYCDFFRQVWTSGSPNDAQRR